MYGSEKDKKTKIMASFPEITQMDVTSDRKHKHLGWDSLQMHKAKRFGPLQKNRNIYESSV